ncbi:MAG: Uma2 family endonuclease, partial [Actinomycetota bacterium]|nr:Uma2 family endonuclease [Actinomycetota bacterium]
HDEVWQGVLHMNPAPHLRHAQLQAQLLELLGPLARHRDLTAVAEFNLGQSEDYRVPDGGLVRPGHGRLFNPTAALVLEVLSPGDETPQKLPFYAARQVAELLILDPDQRTIRWLSLGADGEYHDVEGSALIGLTAGELADQIDWPA